MVQTSSDDDRVHGIDFEPLNDALESVDFPVTNQSLLETLGHRELDVPDGRVAVRSVLRRHPTDMTYDSPSEVREAVVTLVDDDAIGRSDYTDRGTGGRVDDPDSV